MTPDIDTARAQVQEAADALRDRIGDAARVGIILGTGLGKLADEVEIREAIPYGEIPHFPLSTVESHEGRLIAGTLRGVHPFMQSAHLQPRIGATEGMRAVRKDRVVRLLRLHMTWRSRGGFHDRHRDECLPSPSGRLQL